MKRSISTYLLKYVKYVFTLYIQRELINQTILIKVSLFLTEQFGQVLHGSSLGHYILHTSSGIQMDFKKIKKIKNKKNHKIEYLG